MADTPDDWDVVPTDGHGTFYELPDGRMAYEKRNGEIIGPTEHDAVRAAFQHRYMEDGGASP